jgi:hypothetical protein
VLILDVKPRCGIRVPPVRRLRAWLLVLLKLGIGVAPVHIARSAIIEVVLRREIGCLQCKRDNRIGWGDSWEEGGVRLLIGVVGNERGIGVAPRSDAGDGVL